MCMYVCVVMNVVYTSSIDTHLTDQDTTRREDNPWATNPRNNTMVTHHKTAGTGEVVTSTHKKHKS